MKVACTTSSMREDATVKARRFLRAVRLRLATAWERAAVALHLKEPPKRGLRGRLLHRS